MDIEKVEKVIAAFQKNGYVTHFFKTAEEAAAYIDGEIDQTTVGFGDSQTLLDMKLFERLSQHNHVVDPEHCPDGKIFMDIAKECYQTEVFLTSVNGASEAGILINIDGLGNRVGSSLFGHKRVYFVFGTNKIAPSLEEAIWRVRNIAAPRNAKRHGYKTPCALKSDKCYDCDSPQRICNVLAIYYKQMKGTKSHIIIIDENLGY